MNAVITMKDVTKAYNDVRAVEGISLSIEPNKIYGLLGRNGAGKTTLMHMITAQQFPTSGELRVFGEDPYENTRVLSRICFIKESQKYPDNYSIADVLSMAARIFPNWDAEYAAALIEAYALPLKRKMKKLSRGMLSAVGIIVGLASRAELTIFDEPYLGLDAVARSMFYDQLLADYAEYPRTVILSTHLIDEVSQLLEHVFVIDRGRLLLDEEADALRGRAATVTGPAAKAESFAAGREIIHREPFGGLASITMLGELTAKERQEAAAQGLELTPVSLQQMIVHLTNRHSNRKEVHAR